MVNNFYDCAKNGGRVVNRKTKDGKTIKVCYDKKGNSYIKKNKEKAKVKNKQKSFSKPTLESLQRLVERFNN